MSFIQKTTMFDTQSLFLSIERNDAFESGMKDASEYAKETVEEALDIGKALSKKASRFFSSW